MVNPAECGDAMVPGSPAREQGDFIISETKQACLGFGGELGGFVQIHRAARHLHG
jgi:hypothetical protein